MKRLKISDAPSMILALQDEIRRSKDARYDHRLHAVLLVANGKPCREVADLLGDSVRAVQNWVREFERDGFGALSEKERPGRPPRLNNDQIQEINKALHSTPEIYGLKGQIWDGKTLSEFISRQFGIQFGVRQCQRIFHQLGFRLRKPRSMVAGTKPETKKAFKKTSGIR
jgi:transposase